MEPTTKPKKVHSSVIKKKVQELGPMAMIHYNNDLHSLANFYEQCSRVWHNWWFPVTDIYVYDKATHLTHTF